MVRDIVQEIEDLRQKAKAIEAEIDAKIDTLYEGTTAIQGLDFFFRKIVKDHGFELVDHVLHIRALAPVTDAPKRPARKLS